MTFAFHLKNVAVLRYVRNLVDVFLRYDKDSFQMVIPRNDFMVCRIAYRYNELVTTDVEKICDL